MADCSKTLDFSKEFNRLCYTYDAECEGCPLRNTNYSCDGYDVTQEVIDIVQKWSDENPDIPKPCPFCGKTESVHVAKAIEYQQVYDNYKTQYRTVCSYSEGGCGASSGYAKTEKDAIDIWNTRAEDM